MPSDAAIYAGRVVHKRLRPVPHALDYKVFSFLVDVDALAETAGRLRWFSHNRFNVFSVHDRDHGPGDGTSLRDIAVACLQSAGRLSEGRRIQLLAYPRMFGYVFNPLSVFYVYAPSGALETVIYEVNNTFGERKSYVVAAGARQQGGVFAQSAAKEMFVSPFTGGQGGYGFRVTDPGAETLVAVLLSDQAGALLKTHFRGSREAMTDGHLLGLLFRYPLLTLKVIGAIHYEAMKLWLKGVPLTGRHKSPSYSTTPAAALGRKKG